MLLSFMGSCIPSDPCSAEGLFVVVVVSAMAVVRVGVHFCMSSRARGDVVGSIAGTRQEG